MDPPQWTAGTAGEVSARCARFKGLPNYHKKITHLPPCTLSDVQLQSDLTKEGRKDA